MHQLDAKIREALAAEDKELVDGLDSEQSIFEMLAETFRGRHRWLVAVGFVATFAFLGLMVFCAVRFFQAESVRDMIMWTGAFVFCAMAVVANKIWYWMELNKHSVTREVKRVELQIAHLAQRIRSLEESMR